MENYSSQNYKSQAHQPLQISHFKCQCWNTGIQFATPEPLEGTLQSQHPACFFPQHLCALRGHLCLGLIIIIPSLRQWPSSTFFFFTGSHPFPHISLRYFISIPNLLSLHDFYNSECKDFCFNLWSFP